MTHASPSASPSGRAPNFFGLSRAALAEHLGQRGFPGYRAAQLFSWVYRKRHRDPASMTNLPAALRRDFHSILDLALPRIETARATPDGATVKFVLELSDGSLVECVSMRTDRGLTFCVSSQVGCALKCSFCATGLMGLKRNLWPEEIIAQILTMAERAGEEADRFNIVFMGMGEPLANTRNVVESIRILHDDEGLNLGARRITVSTSGLVPQMEELADAGLPVGLAISLHATTDALRDELVPINKRWPIAELLAAAKRYGQRTGRRVTLEYTLLGGVNDGPEDADRLASFARALPSKINLIPYNPVPGLPYQRPTPEAVEAFAHRLYPQAPAVTVRQTMGGEIWAACGQLGGLGPGA